MQPGMEGFMAPYAGTMPMMNYGLGPLDMPFGGVMPHDPFGMQNYMMPVVPPPRYSFDYSCISLLLKNQYLELPHCPQFLF